MNEDHLSIELRERFADLAVELKRTVAIATSPYRDRNGAAAYLNVSIGFVDTLLATGRVKKKYVGSKPLIPVADLERVISEDSKDLSKRRKTPNPKTL